MRAIKNIIKVSVITVLLCNTTQAQVAVIPLAGDDQIKVARVVETYDVLSEIASCPDYGGDTCYEGSGSATCPEGMKVIGGGAQAATTGRHGHINLSKPSSTGDSWECGSTYDIGVPDLGDCFAICVTTEEEVVMDLVDTPKLNSEAAKRAQALSSKSD